MALPVAQLEKPGAREFRRPLLKSQQSLGNAPATVGPPAGRGSKPATQPPSRPGELDPPGCADYRRFGQVPTRAVGGSECPGRMPEGWRRGVDAARQLEDDPVQIEGKRLRGWAGRRRQSRIGKTGHPVLAHARRQLPGRSELLRGRVLVARATSSGFAQSCLRSMSRDPLGPNANSSTEGLLMQPPARQPQSDNTRGP
jgi:hypothetical protein